MRALALLVVGLQGGPWTVSPAAPSVGDTVVIWRAFPGASAVRVRPLAGTELVEPLADPSTVAVPGGVVVRYRVAVFAPGAHALPMPDADVLGPGGTAQAVSGDTARLTVVSVLPAGDSLPPPRPSLGPLPRATPSFAPVAMLVAVVAGGGVTWWGLRRRRGPRPERASPAGEQARAPLGRWMAAGEPRAVAAVAADGLRRAIAAAEPRAHTALDHEECLALLRQTQPAWPLADLAETLAGLERARYSPLIPADLMARAEQAEELAAALERGR